MCVCFNSSETAKGASIKYATIDHHSVVSAIRGVYDVMMTSYAFFKFALLDRGQPLLALTNTRFRLTTLQKLSFDGV